MPSTEFEAFLAQLKSNPMPTELNAMRAAYEGMGQMFPLPADACVERSELGGRPAEWHGRRATARDGVVLFLHGGGYAIGSLNTHRHLAAEIARLTAFATVALDYRLGPEHRFPAAVDDALAAYRQLLSEYPGSRIVLAGDSAGGGLVMATLLAAKAAGLAMPVGAYCMSPWVDLVVTGESLTSKAVVDPLASRETLMLMAERYLGDHDRHDPLASPILADLKNLPPLFIQVGSAEVLLDDSIRLARAAGEADVDVTLEISPHMIHVWPFFFPAFPEGRSALQRACRFIGERLQARLSRERL